MGPILWTIALVLLVAWLLGFVVVHVTAFAIYVLLIVAVIAAVIALVGRARA
jgi:hypothetical protein